MKELICSGNNSCQIIDVRSDSREVDFYPVVWNSTDSWGRQYGPKSFNRTIKNNSFRFPFLREHNASEVIGRTVSAVPDDRGLKVTAKVYNTTAGNDFLKIAEEGDYRFSFGGYIRNSAPKGGVEYVTELQLLEVTATLFPANPEARMISLNAKAPVDTVTATQPPSAEDVEPAKSDRSSDEIKEELKTNLNDLIEFIKRY